MKSGSFFDGRYGQTNFHSNPTKNAPKCIIFILKIQKFFSGERDTPSPHPTLLGAFGASILAPSALDGTPRKNPGYGPELSNMHTEGASIVDHDASVAPRLSEADGQDHKHVPNKLSLGYPN
jgi:hypothetical protein